MFVCFGLPETLSLCISGSSGTLFVDQVCLELRSTYPNLNAERKARTTWLGWFVLTWAHWSMLLEVWEDWVSFALVWWCSLWRPSRGYWFTVLFMVIFLTNILSYFQHHWLKDVETSLYQCLFCFLPFCHWIDIFFHDFGNYCKMHSNGLHNFLEMDH